MESSPLLKKGERLLDLELKGLRIIQDPQLFCFGLDSVLLSGFVRVSAGAAVLDLGTGSGILPLLLSAKTVDTHFTGLEIQASSVDMARRSVSLNALEDRIDIIEGDIREAGALFYGRPFDAVISNPPYMELGSGKVNPESAKSIARHEILCTLKDVIRAAGMVLKSKGAFFMVHRPKRLEDIFISLKDNSLNPVRLRFVHPSSGKDAEMALIEARKDSRSALKVESPLIVYGEDGEYSAELKEKYGY